ncbi:MAG: magnesium transporter [Gammaproteobacteria bacterium]|jgi:magnesium transporter|uniref:magnesium transporter n=1 Tax=Nevskia sp. TaxID=1929292 RepID=UPI004035C22B|nr:magnesium transporter [Gammaproteobacteria bacterium]
MDAQNDILGRDNPHHRNLEHARAQVIEMLTRQAVERELVSRSEAGHGAPVDVVSQLVARQQQAALEQRLLRFHPADIAFVLESLPPEAREMAWALVRAERRGTVLLETTDAVRRSLVEGMPPADIVAAFHHLDSDDIAELIASLPPDTAAEVLARLDTTDQAEVRAVLSFPEGTVGALMDLDFTTVRDDAPLEAVLRLLRRRKRLPADTNQLIVVDRAKVLRGVLTLEQLLLSEPERTVVEVMTPNPHFFYTDDAVTDAIDSFERYDLISAPVVNLHREVVGRIAVDEIVDAIKAQQERDNLRQVGLREDEDLFAPVWKSGRNRWPWLALNLFTAFAASRVIGFYEPTIEKLVALATLMPIVASIGGNTGNQTMALVIRALSLNQLSGALLRKMLLKELLIAAMNGAIWGSALGAVTFAIYHDLKLGLVIATATLLELIVAAAAGAIIPVSLERFGRDPVLGSSVILTALTDSMGFLIFLGLAALVLV